jgi:hypothetical protein
VFDGVKDSRWSADHIAVHNVTMEEAREAILERPFWMVPGKKDTIWIYGRTYSGRYLLLVAVEDHGEAFVVTAREMTSNEKKTFQRKAR